MKNYRHYSLKCAFILCALIATSCAKNESNPQEEDKPDGNAIPNSLHIAFETPDWKRQIDCTHLDLQPSDMASDNTIFYVIASSESTRNTFVLSYPKHASELEKPGNIGKFPVAEYRNPTGPFQYGMILPLDDDKLDASHGRLVSKAGNSATEFTEITEIKRVGTDGTYALFQIKGRYGFNSTFQKGLNDEAGDYVKGTFHLKVRALIE